MRRCRSVKNTLLLGLQTRGLKGALGYFGAESWSDEKGTRDQCFIVFLAWVATLTSSRSTIVGLIIAGVIARRVTGKGGVKRNDCFFRPVRSSFTSVIVAAPCPDNARR